MSILRPLATCALMTLPLGAAQAEPPRVVVDIAPIYGLVAGVMGDLGAPDLMVAQGQSPHVSNMRPSQARALAQAELVVWMGPGLTPWLGNSVEALATEVGHIELLALDVTHRLDARSLAEIVEMGGDHDHGHEHDHAAKPEDHAEGHDDHDEAHGEKHDDHAEGDDDHGHGHDDHGAHEGADPHAWLDPDNAVAWVGEIASALTRLDPENGATYSANAAALTAQIQTLTADMQALLAPVRAKPFLVRHDAYHYLEDFFDLTTLGSLTLSDDNAPSAGAIAALRTALQAQGETCVFVERPEDKTSATRLLDGIDIKITVADPLGGALPLGPVLYQDMMRGMATAISTCLADS